LSWRSYFPRWLAAHPLRALPEEVLAANPLVQKLAALVDDGQLAGHADLDQLRQINSELWSFKSWLQGPGRKTFEQTLKAVGAWEFKQFRG
jgi:hypothetical protein